MLASAARDTKKASKGYPKDDAQRFSILLGDLRCALATKLKTSRRENHKARSHIDISSFYPRDIHFCYYCVLMDY